jgi:hypothetical protein
MQVLGRWKRDLVEFYNPTGSLFSPPAQAQFQALPASLQTFQAAAPPALDPQFLLVLVFLGLLAFMALLLVLTWRRDK